MRVLLSSFRDAIEEGMAATDSEQAEGWAELRGEPCPYCCGIGRGCEDCDGLGRLSVRGAA